jgi:hypothetical protein
MVKQENKKAETKSVPRRVLARVLAEDLLDQVTGGSINGPLQAATCEITGGGTDITNYGGDGD